LEKFQMKKTLVALATIASVSAFAQSTVTISGSLNYGVMTPVTGAQTWGTLKGDRSRITFDVTEDMGGGLSAIGKIEARFNMREGASYYAASDASPYSGKGASLFEQTMVGVSSASLGTLKFGRFTNSLGTYDYSVFEDSKFGTNAARAANGRHSGQAQYESPVVQGFQLQAVFANYAYNTYSAGNDGFGFMSGINYGTYSATGLSNFGAVAVKYANGPLQAQLAKGQGLFNDKFVRAGANYTASNGIKYYGGFYNQTGDVGTIIVDITNNYGSIPGTGYAYNNATAQKPSGMAAHSTTELGIKVPVQQFSLLGGWQRNSKDIAVGVNDGTTKVEKIAFGVEYNLSKRTQVIWQKLNVKNGITNTSNTLWAAGGYGEANGSSSGLFLQHTF